MTMFTTHDGAVAQRFLLHIQQRKQNAAVLRSDSNVHFVVDRACATSLVVRYLVCAWGILSMSVQSVISIIAAVLCLAVCVPAIIFAQLQKPQRVEKRSNAPQLSTPHQTQGVRTQYDLSPGHKVVFNETIFRPGSTYIEPEGRDNLFFLAQYIRALPNLKVEVSGHSDNQGNQAQNLQLSYARAEVVREYLIMLGIEPERIVARGYGDMQPIASNATEQGRAQNRRVEITGLTGTTGRTLTTPKGDAVEPDGYFTLVHSNVQTITPWEFAWKQARVKQPVYELQRVQTSDDAHARITFRDQTTVNVLPNSQLIVYRATDQQLNEAKLRANIGLVKGGLWAKLKDPTLLDGDGKEPIVVRTETSEIRLEQAARISSDNEGRSLISVHQGNARVASLMDNELGAAAFVAENYGTRVAAGQEPEKPRLLPPPPELVAPVDSVIAFHGSSMPDIRFAWNTSSQAVKTRFEIIRAESNHVVRSTLLPASEISTELSPGTYTIVLSAIDSVGLESKPCTKTVVVIQLPTPPFRWLEFAMLVCGVGLLWYGRMFHFPPAQYGAWFILIGALALFAFRSV